MNPRPDAAGALSLFSEYVSFCLFFDCVCDVFFDLLFVCSLTFPFVLLYFGLVGVSPPRFSWGATTLVRLYWLVPGRPAVTRS